MREKRDAPEPREPSAGSDTARRDDDVIRIEDLAPPDAVKGGRKILLGEMLIPLSNPRIVEGS